MLTKEQVLEAVKSGKAHERPNCSLMDSRDYSRLISFFPGDEWTYFGFGLKEEADPPEILEWNRDNILRQLEEDLSFAFEKALGHRGISSSLMYDVIKMWLWVLEDGLYNMTQYAQYGLPLFKATAVKYGFPNPIRDDSGSEYKYSEESEE